MTENDELRRLLDERGVEWFGSYDSDETCWCVGELTWVYGSYGNIAGLGVVQGDITPEQAIEATLGQCITGDTSDGYHTFGELYHHRAILFSVIVRDHKELSWKSKLHHDSTMFDGMFIVGIETPSGQATYHYDIDPYWDMFDCEELERAPEWDGHTPDDAIARISTLGLGECDADETQTIKCWVKTGEPGVERMELVHVMECTECGRTYEHVNGDYEYCPRCGRKRQVEDA